MDFTIYQISHVADFAAGPESDDFAQERDLLGQNMDFSPWHALADHRPLGGFNRARRAVYSAMSNFRRKRNDVVFHMEKPELEDPNKPRITNRMKLQRMVNAYRDKDIQTLMNYLDDDCVWQNVPGDSRPFPYAGRFEGKPEILRMFKIRNEKIASDFLQPSIIGGELDKQLVVFGQEKVEVVDTRKSYETSLVLEVTFNDEGRVSEVRSVFDTKSVAAAFAKD